MHEVDNGETLRMKCCNDLTVIPLIIRGHVVTKQMGQNQISFPPTGAYTPKRNVRAHWRCWVKQRAGERARSQGGKTYTNTLTDARHFWVRACAYSPGVQDRESSYSEKAGDARVSSQRCLGDNRFPTESEAHTDAQTVKLNALNTLRALCVRACVRCSLVNSRLNWCKQISLPLIFVLHLPKERHPLPVDSKEKQRLKYHSSLISLTHPAWKAPIWRVFRRS